MLTIRHRNQDGETLIPAIIIETSQGEILIKFRDNMIIQKDTELIIREGLNYEPHAVS